MVYYFFSYSVLVTKWRTPFSPPICYLTLDVFPWLCDVRLRPRWFLMMSRARVGAKMKWEINWWWHHSDAPAVWVSALSERRNRIAPHRTNPLPRRDKSSAPASQSSPPLINPSDTLPPLTRWLALTSEQHRFTNQSWRKKGKGHWKNKSF